MLVPPRNANLTERRLVESRWIWGILNDYVVTKSFYFGKDHRIRVYQHQNESTWTLNDGVLSIYDNLGRVSWKFEIIFEDNDKLTLVSRHQPDRVNEIYFYLAEHVELTKAEPSSLDDATEDARADDGIRLVIWDLGEPGLVVDGQVQVLPADAAARTLTGAVAGDAMAGAGKIARLWPKVKVAGHADEVLEATRALG